MSPILWLKACIEDYIERNGSNPAAILVSESAWLDMFYDDESPKEDWAWAGALLHKTLRPRPYSMENSIFGSIDMDVLDYSITDKVIGMSSHPYVTVGEGAKAYRRGDAWHRYTFDSSIPEVVDGQYIDSGERGKWGDIEWVRAF